MTEQILAAMTTENAFCRIEIEWCHFYHEGDKKPYWNLFFVSAHCPDIRYPLDTARGVIREFKSIDTAFSVANRITENRIRDIRIIPEPW
jgi:hypothetical protein